MLQADPQRLAGILAQQKAMLEEKRRQLDAILRAVEETDRLLQAGKCEWEMIAGVIRTIQMEQTSVPVRKHLTKEQLIKLKAIYENSYSPEARQKLAARLTASGGDPNSPEAQRRREEWAAVAMEAQRLAAAGADPASLEAQWLAKRKSDLLHAFVQGDPEIEAGVQRLAEQLRSLPKEEWPLATPSPFGEGDAGKLLLEQAMAIYRQQSHAR